MHALPDTLFQHPLALADSLQTLVTMAQGTKQGQTAATAATPNGVTGTHPPAPAAVNRKKQKRREKQAARQAAEQTSVPDTNSRNGHLPPSHSHAHSGAPVPDYNAPEFDEHGHFDGDEYYSDDDEQMYRGATQNGRYPAEYDLHGAVKKSKKKKKGRAATQQPPYATHDGSAPPPPPPLPPQLSTDTFRTVQRSSKDRIWNTSTSEERERIKEFWLSLGEDDRKSLVKIEKEAVLRKMKEQQKHACSCTVCGRKRTAIEEELEVLYDAYYEELEQYANLQAKVALVVPPLNQDNRYPIGTREPPDRVPHMSSTHTPRIRELDDSEEEDDDEIDDEDYSEDEDDDDYLSEDEEELPRGAASDFFNFGNSLTVKGLPQILDR